jgi:hypothetical protein
MQSERPTHNRKSTAIKKNENASPVAQAVEPDKLIQQVAPEAEITASHQPEQNSLTVKQKLLMAEGGYYLSSEATKLLGISEEDLGKWREANKLIGLPLKNGTFVYPKWQFSGNSVLSDLEVVLAQFPYKSPWGRAAFLLDTWVSEELGTPLAGLRAGKLSQVLDLVGCIGEQGAL